MSCDNCGASNLCPVCGRKLNGEYVDYIRVTNGKVKKLKLVEVDEEEGE